MPAPKNLVLGTLATALIAVGVAAQTGTIHLPGATRSASGGVEAKPAHGSEPPSPSSSSEPSPSPSPEPTQAPVAAAPPPAGPPPGHKKKHED